MAQVQIQQITRISPCKLTNGDYVYEEEIIVGADALRYRNGKKKNSCVMGLETQAGTDNQVVVGKYNATSADALFVIGSGTSTSSKKNIVEVKNDKVIINGDLSVSNSLTTKSATISETLTVKDIVANGAIKGTMKNSSGIDYVTTVDLNNTNNKFANYYTKAEVNSTFSNYYTISQIQNLYYTKTNIESYYYTQAYINSNYYTKGEIDYGFSTKLNNNPLSIEMYGNATTKTPFIDFHYYGSIATDYNTRIICKGEDNLTITCANTDEANAKEATLKVEGCLDVKGKGKLNSYIEHLGPQKTNTYDLGDSSNRWKKIYLNNNPNVSSDKILKKDIEKLNIEKYKQTYLSLKPCSYLFKDDEENNTHFGFIAQEVEESFNLLNENKQYALYSKDEKTGFYGMSYAEIIALNTCMIQNLMKENDKLKEEIQKLKGNS